MSDMGIRCDERWNEIYYCKHNTLVYYPKSSVLDGQSSILDDQSSISDGQWSILDDQSNILDGQSSILDGWLTLQEYLPLSTLDN